MHFMFFTFGGRSHVMIQADEKLYKSVKEMLELCMQQKISASDVFTKLMDGWKDKNLF